MRSGWRKGGITAGEETAQESSSRQSHSTVEGQQASALGKRNNYSQQDFTVHFLLPSFQKPEEKTK